MRIKLFFAAENQRFIFLFFLFLGIETHNIDFFK